MLFLCITPNIESLGMELRNFQLNEHIQVFRNSLWRVEHSRPPLGCMLNSGPLWLSREKNCSDANAPLLMGLIGSQIVFLPNIPSLGKLPHK